MKLFLSITSRSQRILRIFALLPLLMIGSPTYAETDANNTEFSQAELDQILAPIALYPDTVLSQVLIAATYPIEVVQADRWARTHSSVKGGDAVKLVEDKDWDPSVKALVAFPDILQRMSDDVDWTQKLGDAFLSDEGRVMDSIQSLRKKAYASGSLNKVQHLKVQRDDDEILIEPAEERVVYVPVYDTRIVYGNWWWPDYPPIYWHHPHYTYVSGFYWGPSIFIGPSFFYSSCHWRNRHVVVVEHHHNHHSPRPYFYTGRSIVHYQGARAWRHEPTHRRGVAYYNNRLRDNYGSRHESYRDAHVYRDQHRNRNSNGGRENYTPTHRQTRFDETHRGNSHISRTNGVRFAEPNPQATPATPTIDRAEQLRDRMEHSREINNNARDSGAAITRADQNNARQNNARQSNGEPIKDSNRVRHFGQNLGAQSATPDNATDHPAYGAEKAQENNRFNRNTREVTNEQATASRFTRQDGNENTHAKSRLERIQQAAMQNNEPHNNSNNNPVTRIDNSMNRRAETTRETTRETNQAPRERSNNEGGGRVRGGSNNDDRARR